MKIHDWFLLRLMAAGCSSTPTGNANGTRVVAVGTVGPSVVTNSAPAMPSPVLHRPISEPTDKSASVSKEPKAVPITPDNGNVAQTATAATPGSQSDSLAPRKGAVPKVQPAQPQRYHHEVVSEPMDGNTRFLQLVPDQD